ncbi:hypothetical protein BJX68DRAFT_272105 [Aspergillus pseudodeflectus]|uniref:Saccharopine dehydrogenase NADP binding domain-containing protein n=1 Tax=Aspergillus pseudodeflectus TaxID=176178 RepID=A0ABR4JHW3_9EURO
MPNLLIYGVTGYTGRLATQHAQQLGLEIVVGGRSETIKTFASHFDLSYRLFDLKDPKHIDSALTDIAVLLNCAGPFHRTAEPLIDACILKKVHYLDVAGELDSYKLAEKHDAEAKAANVMLLHGCGGSVAMLGCLAGHAVARLRNMTPTRIDISLYVVNGELAPQEATNTIQLDFDDGAGPVTNYPVTLPDLITLRRYTKVPNIRTFVHAAGDAFPTGDLAALPDGPTGADGSVARLVLHTVNGYTFTGKGSVEGAKKVLAGAVRAGFQTPAEVSGSRFVEVVEGSSIKDF